MQAQDRKTDFRSDMITQPAIFIGHGSPMVAIEFDAWNENLCRYIDAQERPSAIVIMSAHWVSDGVKVNSNLMPDQMYDYDSPDYPETLSQLTYPCDGDPELASHISSLLSDVGYPAKLDSERGLDHGAWIPLYVTFPNVDVPIVEISVPKNATPQDIYNIGKALAPLRKQGVMLIGSGNLVNNKGYADFTDKYAETSDWAQEFDEWFSRNLHDFNTKKLLQFEKLAPHHEKAYTDPTHVLPVFFVLGAMMQGDYYYNLYDGFHYGNISMRSFAIASNK